MRQFSVPHFISNLRLYAPVSSITRRLWIILGGYSRHRCDVSDHFCPGQRIERPASSALWPCRCCPVIVPGGGGGCPHCLLPSTPAVRTSLSRHGVGSLARWPQTDSCTRRTFCSRLLLRILLRSISSWTLSLVRWWADQKTLTSLRRDHIWKPLFDGLSWLSVSMIRHRRARWNF